jgi:hypothetical protein
MFYKAASPQSVTGPHKSSSSSNCPCTAHGSSDTPCCLAASPLGRHRHPQPKNWGAAGANPPIGDAASPTPPPVPPPSLCQRRPPLHCTPANVNPPLNLSSRHRFLSRTMGHTVLSLHDVARGRVYVSSGNSGHIRSIRLLI